MQYDGQNHQHIRKQVQKDRIGIFVHRAGLHNTKHGWQIWENDAESA